MEVPEEEYNPTGEGTGRCVYQGNFWSQSCVLALTMAVICPVPSISATSNLISLNPNPYPSPTFHNLNI